MGQTNFLQSLGWAMLNSLWQMALLWVIYQFITGIFSTAALGKKIKSSAKSSLASSLLITGFAWFIYTFVSIFTSHTANDAILSAGFVNAQGNEQLNKWLHQTLPVASLIYLILLTLPLLHFTRNYRYVNIIRSNGLTKANVQWRMFVKNLATQMGIKKPVHIWISELVSSPVTIGYLKPVILVPLAAINHLTPQQLEAVLLHELSHIKRYDYLINLIINFIQTILYFNPFVKAFVKIVEREREKSCDEMVIQFQYDSYEYASALLILEKTNHKSKQLAVSASGKKNDLLHRVELILGIHKKSFFSFNKLAGLFAALLCVIAVNALLIMSGSADSKEIFSFEKVSYPSYLFTAVNTNNNETTEPKITEEQISPVINHLKKTERSVARPKYIQAPVTAVVHTIPVLAPGFVNVNFAPAEIPELKKYQEEQVKEAIDASRKVLESLQWKAVEKNIADVFTEKEKEKLKSTYQTEINKIDWNKWEDKLRLAYNKIDWERINDQLGTAVNQIRLDSLQKVYSEAAGNLNIIHEQLSCNNLKGIPDTDITLQEVEQKKQEVNKTLRSLRILRSKKIVHL
ncbi:MAG TPA: M56 family metallopeptidase [Chitinophagaceae bacterium]|nr:M56 family metallopeptidase [Chitinophagaceae bacterium]